MRRVRNNKEICRIELCNFLEDNKVTITNYNEKWDQALAKQMKAKEMETKLSQYF